MPYGRYGGRRGNGGYRRRFTGRSRAGNRRGLWAGMPRGRKYRGRFRVGATGRALVSGMPELKRVDCGYPVVLGTPVDTPTANDGTADVGPGIQAMFGTANYQWPIEGGAKGNTSFGREKNDVLVKDMFFRYTFSLGSDHLLQSDVDPTVVMEAVRPEGGPVYGEILIVQAINNDVPTWEDFFQEDVVTNMGMPASCYNDVPTPQNGLSYDTLKRFRRLNQLPKWRILAHKVKYLGNGTKEFQMPQLVHNAANPGLYSAYSFIPAKAVHCDITIKKPCLIRFENAGGSAQENVIAGQIFQMCRLVGYAEGNTRVMLPVGQHYWGTQLSHPGIALGANMRCRYVS